MTMGIKVYNADTTPRLVLDEASKVLIQRYEGLTVLNSANTTLRLTTYMPDSLQWTEVSEGQMTRPSSWINYDIRQWSSTTDQRFTGTCFVNAADNVSFIPFMVTSAPPLNGVYEYLFAVTQGQALNVKSAEAKHSGTAKGNFNIYSATGELNWSDKTLEQCVTIVAVSTANYGTIDLSFVPAELRKYLYVKSTLGAWAWGTGYTVEFGSDGCAFKFTDGKRLLHFNHFGMYADPKYEGYGAVRQSIYKQAVIVALIPDL